MMQPGPVMSPITSIALSFAQEIGHLAQLTSVLATVHQANWLLTRVLRSVWRYPRAAVISSSFRGKGLVTLLMHLSGCQL